MILNSTSFQSFIGLTILSLILYYGTKCIVSYVERKYKIHIGSLGFLSISDLSYSGTKSYGTRQHSFTIAIGKFKIRIRRPNSERKTWITLIISDLRIVVSSICLFTHYQRRKRIHTRQPSLIVAVPQKAWWSYVWLVKFVVAKLSAIPLQFFISGIANYVDVNVTGIDILIEDLGRFNMNGISLGMIFYAKDAKEKQSDKNQNQKLQNSQKHSISNHRHVFRSKLLTINFTFSELKIRDIASINHSSTTSRHKMNQQCLPPAVSFPSPSVVTLSCHLSPACTSLITFEVDLMFDKIGLGIDSILRLIKSVETSMPKKVVRGPQAEPQNINPPKFGRQFSMANFFDHSIKRKARAPRKRKKMPLEFLKSATFRTKGIKVEYKFANFESNHSGDLLSLQNAQFSLTEFSVSLQQITDQDVVSEEALKFLELKLDFLIDSIYCDVKDREGTVGLLEVDKIVSVINFSKPLTQTDEYNPNSLSLIGTLDMISPEIVFALDHLNSIDEFFDAFIVKDLDQQFTPLKATHDLPDPGTEQRIRDLPKIISTISVVNPQIKITGISTSQEINSLSFGFQDILFDINGDYVELDDLPVDKQKYAMSRRYNKGLTPLDFSLIYNLVSSMKTRKMRLYTRESDLVHSHSWEINLASSVLGSISSYIDKEDSTSFAASLDPETIKMDFGLSFDGFDVRICEKSTFLLLQHIVDVFSIRSLKKKEMKDCHFEHPVILVHPPPDNSQSLLTYLEALLVHVSLTSVGVRIAEVDSQIDPSTSRGVDIRFQGIALDYKGASASIEHTQSLSERIGLGLAADDDNTQCESGGVIHGFIKDFTITPILALWDSELCENTTPLLHIPDADLRGNLGVEYVNHNYELSIKSSTKVSEMNATYSLLYHYCCLVGVMNLVKLIPPSNNHASRDIPHSKPAREKNQRLIEADVSIVHTNISVELPEGIKLFTRVDSLKYRFASPEDHGVQIKNLKIYGTSPVEEELWDELINVENTRILLLDDDTKRDPVTKLPIASKMIRIQSDAVHARIPYKYVLADVTDNAANLGKVIKQLQQRIFKPDELSVPDPEEEGPKILPTIQLKVAIVTFRLEDDPFEGKLSVIWKLGCLEQRARLEREVAFEDKVNSIRSHANPQDETSGKGLIVEDYDVTSSKNGGRKMSRGKIVTDPRSKNSQFNKFRPQPSPDANISISEARARLDMYNSRSWIKCIKASRAEKKKDRRKVNDFKKNLPILITKPSQHPALFRVTVEKFLLTLSTPSFPIDELPQYLNRIGKGLPLDTRFTLLVPMHLNCRFKEAWAEIRDYPLPLACIPSASLCNGKRPYSCTIEGDLVIGEELQGTESVKKAVVKIMSPQNIKGDDTKYEIVIPRTISPVKIYSDLQIKVNTSKPTVISWGIFMQPALQDVAKVFESFTKPNPDPSSSVGFWDKMRLMMHLRVLMDFNGSGDVQFFSKGTRDPYLITGKGAGFVLCWRKDVKIKLGYANDQNEVLQVDSDEFTLAIPNLNAVIADGSLSPDNIKPEDRELNSHRLRNSTGSTSTESTLVSDSPNCRLLKCIMKLCGGVRYGMGCHFNRSCRQNYGECAKCKKEGKCRYEDFVPHYKIITRMPEYAIAPAGEIYDSFKNFRSDVIHLSISVTCPLEWDESVDLTSEEMYRLKNSIHFSPKSLQHGLSWASLFDPAMSIPTRQGALFPSLESPSPKLGKFLQSIKVKIFVGTLFLSHFYREGSSYDSFNERTNILGIKAKIGRFKHDLHLRMQEKTIFLDGKEVKIRDIILHEAEVDLKDLDVRGIVVRYMDTNTSQNQDEHDEFSMGEDKDFLMNYIEDAPWIDEEDYVELDGVLPEAKPGVRVLPLLRSPQMNYYKQPDKHETEEEKKFDQGTHVCLMGQARETGKVKLDFLVDRLTRIDKNLKLQKKLLAEIEGEIKNDPENQELQEKLQVVRRNVAILTRRFNLIKGHRIDENSESVDFKEEIELDEHGDEDAGSSNSNSPSHKHFEHCFVIHNAETIWNNSLRNLVYRLWNLIERHQGLTYYMSMNAVKFIRDMQKNILQRIEKRNYEKSLNENLDPIGNGIDHYDFDATMAAEMLRKLVGEKKANFVISDETTKPSNKPSRNSENINDDVPEGYSLWKKYIVQLINPQINFQSDKNPHDAITMCMERAQLKTFSILEDWSEGDFINEVVKTRTFFGLDNAQFFTSSKEDFSSDFSRVLSANNYGSKNNENWPVWVPIEALINHSNAFPFQRIVRRTSATMQYDKYNNLRIKGSDHKKDEYEASEKNMTEDLDQDDFHKRMDLWYIDFPTIRLTATSNQYCILVDIVSNLLMYREPAKKERSERLNAFLLAADLDDLDGAAERVLALQEQIRQLDEMRLQFKICSDELDTNGIKEVRLLEIELAELQEELCLLMEAITASQNKKKKAESKMALKFVVAVDEVTWIMQNGDRASFCEWALKNAQFVWMTKEENSNMYILEIDHLLVKNRLPSPVFKELICPYITDPQRLAEFCRNKKMIRVYWKQMEPVAGIDIVEHFEVKMSPLKFQMQYDVGKLIMMYIFPEKKKAYMANESGEGTIENSRNHRTSTKRASAESSEKSSKSLRETGHDDANETQESSSEADTLVQSDDGSSYNSSSTGQVSSSKKVISKQTAEHKVERSYELELMKTRASQNRAFVYIKVPGVTHSFSYQGAKEKNLEDLYDFVIRMPTLEYRNKTWSWLDFLEHLKKDALRTILFHSPALLREKLITPRRVRPMISTDVSPDIINSASASPISIISDPMNEFFNSEDGLELSGEALIDSEKMKAKQRKLRESIRLKSKNRGESSSSSNQIVSSINEIASKMSSDPTSPADKPVEEEIEQKGKLLFGRLFDQTRF
ncbi:3510_t:CDS:2 [Acaulospora morrowiae]|uniref:3510_t:CDS:1 n=1 Tax=Acaulospora morrowiae TaxID=94023 RepID=A0A9N9F5Y3_9GLOM|nr:3510_t:CDS:2 [Acaulospora morrowiae]